jgi:hypothetical protein
LCALKLPIDPNLEDIAMRSMMRFALLAPVLTGILLSWAAVVATVVYAVECNEKISDPTPPYCGGSFTTCENIFDPTTCLTKNAKYPDTVPLLCQSEEAGTDDHCDDAATVVTCFQEWRCKWTTGVGCEPNFKLFTETITPKMKPKCTPKKAH